MHRVGLLDDTPVSNKQTNNGEKTKWMKKYT